MEFEIALVSWFIGGISFVGLFKLFGYKLIKKNQ